MSEQSSVILSKSYKLGGVDTNRLTFREPKLADFITIENVAPNAGNNQIMGLLIAQLSGATYPEVVELNTADYQKCARELKPFLQTDTPDGDD